MKKKQYYPGSNQTINIFKKNKDTKFEKENLVKNLYDVKKALGNNHPYCVNPNGVCSKNTLLLL